MSACAFASQKAIVNIGDHVNQTPRTDIPSELASTGEAYQMVET